MNWKEEKNQLVKEFQLGTFSEVVDKLNKVAQAADELDHHPDFEVFGYNNIRFKLNTHTVNKVTEKDYSLAEKIDAILE